MSKVTRLRERLQGAIAGTDVGAVVACYAEGAVLVAPEGRYEGRDYIEAYYRPQFAAFPGAKLTITSAYETDDAAITEWSFTGTNTGALELPGGTSIPATGQRFSQRGVDIALVGEDGLIREHHLYYDQYELIEQLGLELADGR